MRIVCASVTQEITTTIVKGLNDEKPRSIDEPEPKKTLRADKPPIDGFVTIVDGHFKSEFDTVDAAEASGRKLKSTYPMLQIEIYDANRKMLRLKSRHSGDGEFPRVT